MIEKKRFVIKKGDEELETEIIMNFELYGKYFSIFGIKNKDKEYDIYCGEIKNNTLMPIENQEDKEITTKIVNALTKILKG